MRLRPLAATVALALAGARGAAAEEPRLPGEAAELTAEVREKARAHVAAIVEGKEPQKAARALLVLGPVVWPVVEESVRVNVDDAPKPWFGYLKALLVPKAEADFEALRKRVRRTVVVGRMEGVFSDLVEFRRGLPDPHQKGKRLPVGVPAQELPNGGKAYRSGDGTMVVAFGLEGSTKAPDGGDVTLSEPAAGFVAAAGGRGVPAENVSGRGGNASVVAENGFAFGWAGDGADGVKPDGQGGDGGVAEGRGNAGSFFRQGVAGKAATP